MDLNIRTFCPSMPLRTLKFINTFNYAIHCPPRQQRLMDKVAKVFTPDQPVRMLRFLKINKQTGVPQEGARHILHAF